MSACPHPPEFHKYFYDEENEEVGVECDICRDMITAGPPEWFDAALVGALREGNETNPTVARS